MYLQTEHNKTPSMGDPRDRRSYRQRQAIRQRAKKIQKTQSRKLTKADYIQISIVIAVIIAIVLGSIWLADRL